MPGANFTNALNQVAMECALRRINRRCRCEFGCSTCNNCDVNINNYIDADPRHIKLFMFQAEQRAWRIKNSGHNVNFAFLVVLGVIAVIVLVNWYQDKKYLKRYTENQHYEFDWGVEPTTSVPKVDRSPIVLTLQKVSADLQSSVDVDGDGDTNCVDAAVLFYKYYPNKSDVCIIVNKHPTNGFHHLFNGVKIDGVWKAIEPQAIYGNRTSFYMSDIWLSKYDKQYNVDVTSKYKEYL